MTHDELLAKLDEKLNIPHHWGDSMVAALRAIVEMHKPEIPYGLWSVVEACPIDGDIYPCDTIRAIKEQLL
jgi:hypothetical protein